MLKLTSRLLSVAAVITIGATVVVQPTGAQPSGAAQQAEVDPAEREGIIFERQQLMTKIEEESELLGQVVAGIEPTEKMAPAARAIANLAKESITAFQPVAPGGRAKPEVWSNAADYSQRMRSFAEKADEMAKKAEAGDTAGVISVMGDALPCKQCHDIYRAPKKNKAG